MKTAVTDKTLSYLPFNPDTKPERIMAYVEAVFACGADYVEINGQIAELLRDEDLSERFILRIKQNSDIKICCEKQFAYVVVPHSLRNLIRSMSPFQQIIVEAHVDEFSAHAVLLGLHHNLELTNVSMIRLVGVFGDSDDSVGALVKWNKRNSYIPLDICPLNTMMTGVSDAISAYAAGVDMITLSFGRGYYFSALEQYLISVHILKKSIMQGDVIKGICRASLIFTEIFSAIPTGLERILETDSEIGAPVFDIETGISFRPFRSPSSLKEPLREESVIERKIKSIGLEREIEDAIIDTLKKVDFNFYRDITKRNHID